VLATWVVESTEVPICVALVGPAGPERRQLLRLLRCLFRRGLVLSGVNLANLSTLPMNLTPSLLIDHCEQNAALRTFLYATNSPEAHLAARGQLFNLCCAKVLCIDDPLDRSLRDFPVIQIPVVPRNSTLHLVDHRAQKEILEEFQPKLLMYRLINLAKVRDSRFDPTDMHVPWRDVAGCLGASVAGDAGLQSKVTDLIKKQEEASQQELEKFFSVIVLEALLRLCHQTEDSSLTVGAIAREANRLMEERGELISLQPRSVGSILRALRIPTESLGAQGRGIILLKELRQRIHFIAKDHRINLGATKPGACQICFEVDPENGMHEDPQKMTPEDLENWY